ncbi:MAG: TRAP transporter TatT component family protein [Fidelibacterota bacterium]
MLTNTQIRSIILSISMIVISSCSTSYYLNHYPQLTKEIFYKKIQRTERKLNQDNHNPDLLLAACQLRTQYTFAFIVEEADRLIETDFNPGKNLYQVALKSFQTAITNGETALRIRYPDLTIPPDHIYQFTEKDIPYLYWWAAALGGAIGSSRGKPEWVIQLPKIGYLLESALAVDSTWNYGAIHAALISYSMVRTDLKDNNEAEAVKHYEKVNNLSHRQDLSAHVSFAENVLVSQQKSEEFEKLLNNVITQQPTDIENLELGNIIAKKRAKWLLSRKDELFY